jgi:glutathione peroxidase
MAMTLNQKIRKFIYPLILLYSRLRKKNLIILNNAHKKIPLVSFYTLKASSNSGKEISFEEFRGKKVIIVNVASNCGYTRQYDSLEKLYEGSKDKLVILGFPANNFNEQEPDSDQAIEKFCKLNYGVSFPLFKKASVLKPHQNEVYQWLSDKTQNGWNDRQPMWNFSKYLIDEKGVLTHFFGPAITPENSEIKEALRQ